MPYRTGTEFNEFESSLNNLLPVQILINYNFESVIDYFNLPWAVQRPLSNSLNSELGQIYVIV